MVSQSVPESLTEMQVIFSRDVCIGIDKSFVCLAYLLPLSQCDVTSLDRKCPHLKSLCGMNHKRDKGQNVYMNEHKERILNSVFNCWAVSQTVHLRSK